MHRVPEYCWNTFQFFTLHASGPRQLCRAVCVCVCVCVSCEGVYVCVCVCVWVVRETSKPNPPTWDPPELFLLAQGHNFPDGGWRSACVPCQPMMNMSHKQGKTLLVLSHWDLEIVRMTQSRLRWLILSLFSFPVFLWKPCPSLWGLCIHLSSHLPLAQGIVQKKKKIIFLFLSFVAVCSPLLSNDTKEKSFLPLPGSR